MLPISALIIAKNEGYVLDACLRSIHGWVKEIIVVINDCTDNTKEVAESFAGVKVVEHPWSSYCDQRNFALSLATQPWILRLDADEEVTDELKKSLEDFFQETQCDDSYSCIEVSRADIFFDKKFFGNQKILFKAQGLHWINIVHECPMHKEGLVKFIDGILIHRTSKNVLHTLIKNVKYAQLNAGTFYKKYSLHLLMFKAFVHPIVCFLKFYFIKKYVLSGFAGFYLSVVSSLYCFCKYLFAVELRLNENKNKK